MSTTHTSPARRARSAPGELSRRVFVVAALTCGGAWLVKQAAIALNGGEGSTVVALLWGLGMTGLLVCAAAGVATLLATRPWWVRWPAALVAVPAAFVANGVVDGVVKSLYPGEGWFRDELGLVLVGVSVAVLAVLVRGPRPNDGDGLS